MTMTRKERIERAALAFFARHDDSIEDVVANAEFLIDAIDALPDEPDHKPDHEPDHIEEINKLVDDVFGIPDPNEKVDPKIYPGEAVYCDDNGNFVNKNGERLEKVELPGKWWAKDDWIAVCGDREFPMLNACDSDAMCEARNADMDAAREYWFREGVEAAAACLPDNSVNPEIVRRMLAIQPPKID